MPRLALAGSVFGLAVIAIVSWSTRSPVEVIDDEGLGKSVTNIAVATATLDYK